MDDGLAGVTKSLLTEPDFIHQLVTNKEVHAAFDKMMSGDLVQGAKSLFR